MQLENVFDNVLPIIRPFRYSDIDWFRECLIIGSLLCILFKAISIKDVPFSYITLKLILKESFPKIILKSINTLLTLFKIIPNELRITINQNR